MNGDERLQVSGGTLFNDGLHLIFTFLADSEWKHSQVWLVNRQWLTASIHLFPRCLRVSTLHSTCTTSLASLISSRIRHHVAHVHIGSEVFHVRMGRNFMLGHMKGNHLIGQLTWIMHITIDVRFNSTWEADFEPLTLLPELRHLTAIGGKMSDTQLRAISRSQRLVSIHVGDSTVIQTCEWTLPMIEELCQTPHNLHNLEFVDLHQTTVGKKACELLTNLPALTELSPQRIDLGCIPLLEKFPHLTRLSLRPYVPFLSSTRSIQDLVSVSHHLRRITDLEISNFSFGDSENEIMTLTTIMSQLISLYNLTLSRCVVDSLVGVSSAPKLEILHIKYYRGYMTTELLSQLVGCSTLRSLVLTPVPYGYPSHPNPILAPLEIQLCLPQLTTCQIHT